MTPARAVSPFRSRRESSLAWLSSLLVTLVPFCGCSRSDGVQPPTGTVIRAAGSTFAAPLYHKWAQDYRRSKPDVFVEYEAIGSGEGEDRFLKRMVDFGATDAGLTPEEIATVAGGVVTIPIATGGIALAYNVPGIGAGLKLPRDVYADIFLGKIKVWNDPRIAAANPGLSLPKLSISLIVRLDGSGTTFAFTSHLSAISSAWASGPGIGKVIAWPTAVRAMRGNERLAGAVRQVEGGIGYVEYGTARAAGLSTASLQNKSGEFIGPSNESLQKALTGGATDAEMAMNLRDPASIGAYPIVTGTWLLAYKNNGDAARSAHVRDFVRWCLTEGQHSSEALGFVPLSPEIAAAALQTAETIGR